MVYTPALKKVQKKIFLPTNLFVLSSLGIHLLFFIYLLPQWNLDNSKENKRVNTPVIELNPLEASRLPDSSPQSNFNWNLMSQLPQSDPEASNIPMPTLDSFQFPLNNNLPNLPPPPSPNFLPNYNFSIPNLPNIPSPPNIARIPSTRPRYYNVPNISNYSSNNWSRIPNPSSTLPPPPSMDMINPNLFTNYPPDIGANGNFIDITPEVEENDIRQRQSLFSSNQNSGNQNPRDLINNKSPDALTSNPFSGNSSNLPNQNQVAVNSSNQKISNYITLSSALQKNTANTTNQEATRNDIAWRSKTKVAQPKSVSLAGIYPKDACARRLKGVASYGVTVNGGGSVVNTTQLRSTGYPLFDNQAARQIRGRNFGGSSQGRSFHVHVNFQPNNCPSITVNNVGKTPNRNVSVPQNVNVPTNTRRQTPSNNTPRIRKQPKTAINSTPVKPPVTPVRPETQIPVRPQNQTPVKPQNQTPVIRKQPKPAAINSTPVKPPVAPVKPQNQTPVIRKQPKPKPAAVNSTPVKPPVAPVKPQKPAPVIQKQPKPTNSAPPLKKPVGNARKTQTTPTTPVPTNTTKRKTRPAQPTIPTKSDD